MNPRAESGVKNVSDCDLNPLHATQRNTALLNSIGAELAEKYGIPWLYSDFKKREGYKRSIILSKEYDLYRQNYCGCVFSKRDSMQSKN